MLIFNKFNAFNKTLKFMIYHFGDNNKHFLEITID